MTVNETFTNDADRLQIRSLFSVLGRFRDLDGDMPIQQAICFVWVTLNEGKSQRELRQQLDMASSTSSRNLAALSKVHRLGKAGLGLIEFVEDPLDRRSKQLYLTAKGRTMLNTLTSDLR